MIDLICSGEYLIALVAKNSDAESKEKDFDFINSLMRAITLASSMMTTASSHLCCTILVACFNLSSP